MHYSRRWYPGWTVVAGAFGVTFVGFGGAYSFSVFLRSLQHDFNASRGAVSLVFSLAGFLYFALGGLSGPLADRVGSRAPAVVGMLFVGLGLVIAGTARSLAGVYAGYGLGIGLGVGLSYVPAIAAVQRWFVRQRGFASGLAVSGIGLGTLLVPPLASWLIDAVGWRDAYLALGVGAVIAGVGMALLIKDDPRTIGLLPDGDVPPPAARTEAAEGVSLRDAIRSTRFLYLYGVGLFVSVGLFVPFVHLVPYAQGQGISRDSAVLLLGVIGIGSTAGRVFLGGLSDRSGRLAGLLVMVLGMAGSLVIWALSAGFWALAAFAFIFGIFYGGFVALIPAVVMDDFGGRNISSLIGILYTSVAFGTLIGPSAAGYAFDAMHSYEVAILASIAANLIGAGLIAATSRAPAPAHALRLTGDPT